MTHTQKATDDHARIVGTIEIVCEGADGITALVNGKRQTFPNLRAAFVAAIQLLDKHLAGSPHAIQRELLPTERNLP